MLSVNFCSMCFFNVSILHPRSYIEVISLSLLNQYKHDLGRPQQSVQCDRIGEGGVGGGAALTLFSMFTNLASTTKKTCWSSLVGLTNPTPTTIFGLWSYLVVVTNLTSTTIFAFWSSLVVFAYLASATVITCWSLSSVFTLGLLYWPFADIQALFAIFC